MLVEHEMQMLREQHGAIQEVIFENDDGQDVQIVLRRPRADRNDPKVDEFFAFWTRRAAIEQTPKQVQDPTQDGTAELLRCLVHPDPMTVRKHLADYPGDVAELREIFRDLAGDDAVADAPQLVTEDVKANFHRRALGMMIGGSPVIARPMSAAEYSTFLAKNGGTIYPMRAEALAWAAWSCVSEQPDKDKRKPGWDALVAECPMGPILMGIALLGAAKSRVKEREKKSVTPSAPPSEKGATELSAPAAPSCTPSPRIPEASTDAPAAST